MGLKRRTVERFDGVSNTSPPTHWENRGVSHLGEQGGAGP